MLNTNFLKTILITVVLMSGFSGTAQYADIDILKKLNGSYTPQMGKFIHVMTESVNPVAIGLPIGLFATGWIKKDKEMMFNSAEMVGAMLVSGVFTTSMKLGFHRPRPSETYPDDIVKYAKAGSYSFPSGHTSMAFVTATSISLIYPKWYVVAPAYAWASVVGFSRMYLGVHYPSDVLVGALVGSGSAVLTHFIFKKLKVKYAKKQELGYL
jgi:membrane-associated phospholipid phosphatase